MPHRITLIPGDGIGPEVTDAALAIFEACGLPFEWDRVEAGAGAADKYGTTLPESVLESIRSNRVALKGPLTTPVGGGFKSVNVTLRKTLDLYVSLRPVQSLPGLKTPYENVDLVVFRENTEGLYAGLEQEPAPGKVESLRVITEHASRRLAKHALEWCRREGRRRVHLVHQAALLRLSDGLFLDVASEVARGYPDIETTAITMDHLCLELARDPTRFDALVTENLLGDVVSDLAAGLVGGLGVVPGANLGDDFAVFEAVHGSAPDIAGKGLANPIAIVRSGVLMLRHLGEREAAERIERAVLAVLAAGEHLTPDLGGKANTGQLTEAIIAAL